MRLDVKKASARGLAIGFATALVSLSTGSAKATSAQTAVAGSGLVAAYSFDEGSGTTAADSSGDGNTGTISNATWTPAGKFGSALSFNGTSSWLTVPDSSSLDLTTAMTLEAWVKPASLSGWDAIVEKEQPGELAYALYANSDTNQPDGIVYINSEQDTRAGGQLPLNSWSHVAATYDGSTLAVYVNGTLVSSRPVTGSIKTSTGMLRIGGDSVWGEYFNGLIDEVRVYNGVLTASAIQADMTTPVNTSASAPANTAAPTISGSTVVGSTLTASTGAWSNSPISYAYEWKRCDGSGASCTAISGATASTYTVGTVDSGSTLGVTVTASNSAGSAQATSAQTAVVGSALVAAYSFDEGSGTTATDASGSGNNGTISGATWSTAGHSGGALSFDGSSSLVTVPDSATLDLG